MSYLLIGGAILIASLYGVVIFGTLMIDTNDEYFKG